MMEKIWRLATIVLAALLVGGGAVTAPAQVAPSHSAAEGVFTDAQAKRGEDVYASRCAQCHGDDLVSRDDESPSLSGLAFTSSWVGKTLGDRFKIVRTTMPPTDPGGIDEQTCIDIVAFILKFNGYPAGEQEMPAETGVLETIRIDALR
jgi:mono/diheme cytochrome c family protein